MVRKARELRPVMTRLPEGLRHRLEREAEQNGRSMNAEIIERLGQSFAREDRRELIESAVEEMGIMLDALLHDVPEGLRQVHDQLGNLGLALRERDNELLQQRPWDRLDKMEKTLLAALQKLEPKESK